jgi:hypothetical protein
MQEDFLRTIHFQPINRKALRGNIRIPSNGTYFALFYFRTFVNWKHGKNKLRGKGGDAEKKTEATKAANVI